MSKQGSNQSYWSQFHGPNMGYVEEQYDLYLEDPERVDSSLKDLFETYGAPVSGDEGGEGVSASHQGPDVNVKNVTSAMKLVEAIRRYGHLEADIYPIPPEQKRYSALLDQSYYDLTDEDLEAIPANWIWSEAPQSVQNGKQVVESLRASYAGTVSFEVDHVNNNEERKWLQESIESGDYKVNFNQDDQKQLLERLSEVESFEQFLGRTFVAQKRFSIEGLDVMVPMLDRLVQSSSENNIENIMMGMAHRGRLNVLAHVLGKPYERIFSEFHHAPNKELVPSEGSRGINYGWTGDVKYHFGAHRDVEGEKAKTRVTLSHNPSHLEYVNPVVEGFARAAQDDRSERGNAKQDFGKAFSILIHGDAAFPGEGVVTETLNMSDLPGYRSGGSIHIIANNLLGFTTAQEDGRSTRYASDPAKGFEIPIIHVNADDPEACLSAAVFAFRYRQKFHKDFLIDLVGYRRYGHNEMDEPRATQPYLYGKIDEHPTVAKRYADRLHKEGVVEQHAFDELKEDKEKNLRGIYESMKENETGEQNVKDLPEAVASDLSDIQTAISFEDLNGLNEGLLKRPDGFNVFKKLERILQRREKALEDGNKVDWALGEALAFASILKDGYPIRLTGQDSQRGTFAHRHLVLHDTETNETYCPMHGLEDAKASFSIHNSPLSEAGVLGFEYGYSVQSPGTLVLWEAQYGDFANAGQVIIDQFISAGRAKWGEKSSIALLLPHGYEGQGPEHSSARLERYLTLSAEHNWTVANVTSAAQYFHLLRRQAIIGDRDEARPLVLMTPKSLIRNNRVASFNHEFTEQSFQPLKLQDGLGENQEAVTRLVLGSGKVMIDLEEAIENAEDENFDHLHIGRVEQIYPFPSGQVEELLNSYPNVEEIVWVQEEPKNMGSWDFVKETLYKVTGDNQTLSYIGRPKRSSPSVGEPNIHKTEQNRIIHEALKLSKGGDSNERN
ncbi:2-oxoglutarate dehydrogenase E1 [Pontibacillus halophilus JSM 076056 = DSM 19796]|uniref:2-oxoglutarate dehydrogenase E1 component n=1 Tax=Pontibacillus halophilus JSM 076056 = DSM 19796 TaxID=1385510 RepID=A0A0A5GFA7_9BACI|nr:2-oxoglutarate dehydrogenase E1 component [Pontibacillus halophilus]KGX90684.1 2-oxoglutarate dehydrogenase E1 [Pontibacillus halophilus JSM 076056 = DSM 19796]